MNTETFSFDALPAARTKELGRNRRDESPSGNGEKSFHRHRIGVFCWKTAPEHGGSDTISRMLEQHVSRRLKNRQWEVVPIPWQAWDNRRQLLRRIRRKLASGLGSIIPPIDLRPVCRRYRLDAAYFVTPSFVDIDIPYIYPLWDMGHRMVPGFPEISRDHGWQQREALCQRMLLQATFVTVGNESGAKEASAAFGIGADRVVALPFPNPDFSAIDEIVPAWMPRRPFFFYPAQGWAHKNHYTLLYALANLAEAGETVPELVFSGADKYNFSYLKSVALSLGVLQHVHFAGFLPLGEIKTLYRRAAGLVFPSVLGPNNLPPQEAAVLECPVILSDLPGHREQMADGALYAAPLDAHAWSHAMHSLMNSADLRQELTVRAKEVVAAYSVEVHIGRLAELFSRLSALRALWA